MPRDSLPEDWLEGTEVEVEKTASNGIVDNGIHPADAWMDEVERSAAQQDPADDLRLQQAIDEERRRQRACSPGKMVMAKFLLGTGGAAITDWATAGRARLLPSRRAGSAGASPSRSGQNHDHRHWLQVSREASFG